ncbi:MAG: 50S ribosomal protein L22 [Parcubacteria group bacterium]
MSKTTAKTTKLATNKPALKTATRPASKVNKIKRAEAHIRYIHMAPQKVQRIATLVRGLPVLQAESLLESLPKRASIPVLKALRSARSNATHNHDMDAKQLHVESVRVGQSMTLPRMMPRAQGRAYRIRKRFSHIDIVLIERAAPKRSKVLTLKER